MKKRIALCFCMVFFSVLLVLACAFSFASNRQKDSNAATGVQTVQGTQLVSTEFDIGDLLFNYSTASNDPVKFDGNVLDQLYEALTGKKGATYHDVYMAANGGRNATAIASGNASLYGGAKYIKFRFGTINWTAAYLFRQGNDVYLDIMEIGDQLGVSTFAVTNTSEAYNNTNKYPSSMYGSSWVRSGALNGGGVLAYESSSAVKIDQNPASPVAVYTMANGSYTYRPVTLNLTSSNIAQPGQIVYGASTTGTVKGSLTDYIAKPSQISYQETESSLVPGYWTNSKYYMPSDCYGTSATIPGASWHTNFDFRNNASKTGAPTTDPGYGVDVYNCWKDDYLWIPSFNETYHIWDLNYAQLQTSAATAFWSRSPRCQFGTPVNGMITVLGAGGSDGWCTTARYYTGTNGASVRPALHLNLTKAAKNAAYTAPSGSFSSDYNGDAQTALKLQTGLLSTYSGGYSPTLADKESATDLGFQIAYYKGKRGDTNGGGVANGAGNVVTSMTDAGDYEVAVKFPATGGMKWKTTTTDGAKGEDAETRVYDFKIKQKAVTLTMTVNNKGVVTITAPAGAVYTRDGTVSAAGFTFEYAADTGNIAGGKAENWYSDHDKATAPEYAGKYKVTLTGVGEDAPTTNSPTNFNPDKKNFNNNYNFSTIPQTKTFTYPKTQVSAPTVSGGSGAATVAYDGTEHTFTMVYDSDRITLTILSTNNGNTNLTLADDTDGKPKLIKGTHAGVYTVRASLKDDNDSEWDSGTAGGTRDITLTISPIKLNFTASKPNDAETGVPWAWTLGATGNITVKTSLENVLSADASGMTYELCFYKDGEDPANAATVLTSLCDFTWESGTPGQYPKALADITKFTTAGSYKLYVRVKPGTTENTDYEIVNSFPDTITVSAQALSLNDLIFKITQDGAEYQVKVTYNTDGTFTLSQNGSLPTGAKIAGNILELVYSPKAYDIEAVVPSTVNASVHGDHAGTNNGYTGALHVTTCSKLSDGSYDTVKVTVCIKAGDGAEFDSSGTKERTYELVYRLNPFEFDLSKMDWNYKATNAEGKVTWPEYSGSSYTVALVNVPAGLKATYGNATKTEPGQYTTTVTFNYDTTNYKLPTANALDSFASYNWEIRKILIDTSVWDDPDKDNASSNSPVYWAPTLGVPAGGTDYSDKIFYKYYPDSTSAKADSDGSAGSDDFEIDETTTEIYCVRVFVKPEYAQYYEIDTDHDYTYDFTVGSGKSAVRVKYPQTSYEYDGKEHFGKDELEFIGLSALNIETDFEVKYYPVDSDGNKGTTALDGKPKAVGRYIVELSLTAPASTTNVLATKSIAVEITAITLDTSGLVWTIEDEQGKPIAEYDAHTKQWIYVKADKDGKPQHVVLDKNADPTLYSEVFGYKNKGGVKITLKGDVLTTATDNTGKPIPAVKTEGVDGDGNPVWTFTREIDGKEETLFTLTLNGAHDPEANKAVDDYKLKAEMKAGAEFEAGGAHEGMLTLPDALETEWEIVKAKIDGTRLAWDYPEEGYQYELGEETNAEGQKLPRERTVRIVMLDEAGNPIYEKDENGEYKTDAEGNYIPVLPEGLAVSYTGAGHKSSGVGKHGAKAEFTLTDTANYEFGSFSNDLSVTKTTSGYYTLLNWEIGALSLDVPKAPEADIVFNAQEVPNLLEKAFENDWIRANWKDYLTVTVTYQEPDNIFGNPETKVDENGNPILTADNAGKYTVVFTIIDPDNVSWADGTKTPQAVTMEVKPFEIVVTGWGVDHRPTFENDVPSDYYELKFSYFDAETGEEKPTTNTSGFDITYYVRIAKKESYGKNVTLRYADGVDEVHEFSNKNPISPNTTKIDIPTLSGSKLTYNGTSQTLNLNGLTDISKQVIEVFTPEGVNYEDGVFTFRNAGEYTISIGIKSNANAVWSSLDEEYNESKRAITYKVVVEKAKIAAAWTSGKKSEPPTLSVPEGFTAEAFAGMIEYVYTDANGNRVLPEALEKGVAYTVTARIKSAEAENAGFVETDESGAEVLRASVTNDFTIKAGGSGLNGLFGLPDEFPLWQIIVIVICLILFIIFMILTAKKRKEKKEAEEEIKKYQDGMMDEE